MSLARRLGLQLPLGLAAAVALRPALAQQHAGHSHAGPLHAAQARGPNPLDAVESKLALIGDLTLQSGVVLPNVQIAFETYGTLNAAADNAILLTHGFTSSHHAAGRYAPHKAPPGVPEDAPGTWDSMIGAGKPLDPARFFMVSSNMLGSAYGSTGPRSIDPATGEPWGPDFPHITLSDIVAAQRALLDQLGVQKLVAVMGTSYGGYQGFTWAVDHPGAMRALIATNTSPHGSGTTADVQRQIDRLARHPNWNGGHYHRTGGVEETLVEIRIETLKRYGMEEALMDRFPDPIAREMELRRMAEPWARAFDANSLVTLRRAAVHFDAGPQFARIKARVLYALTSTDQLFPPIIAGGVMKDLKAAGVDATYFEIVNNQGHVGAAVASSPGWVPMLTGFINRAVTV